MATQVALRANEQSGDPVDATPTPEGNEVPNASQWQLVWRKFRKHKLALAGGIVTILIYLVAIFAEFLAPFVPKEFDASYTYAPPQRLRLIDRTDEGTRIRPYVYGYSVEIEPEALRRVFAVDETQKIYLRFFGRGSEYRLWGLFPARLRMLTPVEQGQMVYLLGADRFGRDVLTRVIYGTRISMSIGLVGVALSLILGIVLGGVSGYYGGKVDLVVQRVIELLRSIPTIPLWMGFAAAIPVEWPPVRVYFTITVILSLIGWTTLARVVRGKFVSLRTEDFVAAARLDAVPELTIITRHMVPSFASHIIAAVTLAVPRMIISETALSFLGIGLRPPVVSWGVLLQGAQNIRVVSSAPWIMIVPALAVVIAVLALNFLGDGLRDAADPYA